MWKTTCISIFSDPVYFAAQKSSNQGIISNHEEDIEVCNLTRKPPNIATSVRLSFSTNEMSNQILNRMKRNWWSIEQTIIVHKTVPSTYFGVIQIPGIYAGLQQLPNNECSQSMSKLKKNTRIHFIIDSFLGYNTPPFKHP